MGATWGGSTGLLLPPSPNHGPGRGSPLLALLLGRTDDGDSDGGDSGGDDDDVMPGGEPATSRGAGNCPQSAQVFKERGQASGPETQTLILLHTDLRQGL